MTYPSQYRPAGVPTSQVSNYNKLYSEVLGIVDQSQDLLVLTAAPGSEDADKLALLSVLGRQEFTSAASRRST